MSAIFRNKKIKPLVGDNVEIDVIDQEKFLGNINEILPRNNSLIRPAVANVDQAVIIFAVTKPEPNYSLLARFIMMMNMQNIDTVICFNKRDLAQQDQIENLQRDYRDSGCKVLFTSTYEERGIEEFRELLNHKTTVLAGPSGVGKSSITNLILPGMKVETGSISEKIGRGKHTTRHSEIFNVEDDTYILDTPGFTSLYMTDMEKEDVRFYFHEFEQYEGKCRFNGCAHVNEPDCAVKQAVEEGKISKIRYQNYIEIYNEIKEQRKY